MRNVSNMSKHVNKISIPENAWENIRNVRTYVRHVSQVFSPQVFKSSSVQSFAMASLKRIAFMDEESGEKVTMEDMLDKYADKQQKKIE